MDKEQAIDLLDNLIGMIEDNQDNDYDTAFRMAIEALKAQLSHEGTTSDLISRTETVEHLRGVLDVTVPITDYDGGYVDGVEVGISTVSTMPTIQPVATDTNVGDTISRQAALEKVRAMQTYKLFMGDDMILVDKAEVQTELMMLPTVQPEVLACGSGELVAQPEPTYEQVEEYCKKRCLHVVTADFFESTKPQRLGHWVDGRCNECGGQAPFWVMASTYYESDFCPHCGAKMTISTK